MKKLLLSLVAVAGLVYSANAQTEKGKFMLGGNVGFNSTKVDGAPKADINFSVIPSVGYFVGNNFAVGTGVGYTYEKSVSGRTQEGAFEVAPFGRYYVNLTDQFKFFGQLSVPLAFGTQKAVDANGDTGAKLGTTTSIGVNVAPGFAFFPTKRIGIEVSVNGLGYENYQVKNEATGAKVKSNSFGLEANTFAPKLGVMFHF
ncbi:outer membrane beta-barrel protein [Pedobacter rhizosphaerae]|uniref:Outer membrane protein beta-barrel domain-containing protein n=1 Tax=Pedobacter rhizosphaerae TaxID=390241 RepID=A0A1H9JR72_9SPHI|nr:outer membrane beta-barrel protein [Pedobacter rhizosphaerae]SEQ89346.1 Outer membrane protein beta-barrel domain-containing protein [Pedobacter rhizosphaerae]